MSHDYYNYYYYYYQLSLILNDIHNMTMLLQQLLQVKWLLILNDCKTVIIWLLPLILNDCKIVIIWLQQLLQVQWSHTVNETEKVTTWVQHSLWLNVKETSLCPSLQFLLLWTCLLLCSHETVPSPTWCTKVFQITTCYNYQKCLWKQCMHNSQ